MTGLAMKGSAMNGTGPVKALLVDLDGTLADTADANYAAYAAALAEAGVEPGRDAFDAVAAGRNWRQFLPVLLGETRTDEAPGIAARKTALYADMLHHVRINTPLVRMIEAFLQTGRAALVTTASRASVDAILAHHDLARLFEVTITGDEVTQHKPHPQPYLLAAEALDLAPGDCLAIEDSDVGAASAETAGCPVLRVVMTS